MTGSNGAMLKRRPSKRFVLAETGEEPSWDITMDNEGGGGKVTSPVPPPVINLETAVPSGSTSASSSVCEDCPPAVEGDGEGRNVGSDSGSGGAVRSNATGAGELKVPVLHNLKLTESGRLK